MGLWNSCLALLAIIVLVFPPEQCEAFECDFCDTDGDGKCVGVSDSMVCGMTNYTSDVCAIKVTNRKSGKKSCLQLEDECIMKVLKRESVPGCVNVTGKEKEETTREVKECKWNITVARSSSIEDEYEYITEYEDENQTTIRIPSSRQGNDMDTFQFCTCNSTELCNAGDIMSLGGARGDSGNEDNKRGVGGGGDGDSNGVGSSLKWTEGQVMISLLLYMLLLHSLSKNNRALLHISK